MIEQQVWNKGEEGVNGPDVTVLELLEMWLMVAEVMVIALEEIVAVLHSMAVFVNLHPQLSYLMSGWKPPNTQPVPKGVERTLKEPFLATVSGSSSTWS